ncbi:zinc ribbon domain-containing protein [Zhihengliuella flava]|uniref:Nucleic acid-binding Zn-ribbon protein n=1 Tax=Zhihengliuella flava TaxID=1285193 RepID=A0A931DAP8_9MICC|nr:C4-type zinc ribbon domain-containing protein [Zhihengliuella flava]MBG6083423.1 putative nucleic acid-binding Zn-ribbon protein [Zhihengliuella flava]
MAKASPQEQRKLLTLAERDADVARAEQAEQRVWQHPDLPVREQRLAEAAEAAVAADSRVNDVQSRLAASEAAVAKVQAHRDKDQRQLDAGAGTAQDLMALSHELQTLGDRQNALEEEELVIMEELEDAQSGAAEATQERDASQAHLEALRAELTEEAAARAEELRTAHAARAACAQDIEPTLLALYDKARARRGVGAARLYHGVSEGSGLKLAPGDLQEIKNAADDDVVYCPDSGALLVRDPEWMG